MASNDFLTVAALAGVVVYLFWQAGRWRRRLQDRRRQGEGTWDSHLESLLTDAKTNLGAKAPKRWARPLAGALVILHRHVRDPDAARRKLPQVAALLDRGAARLDPARHGRLLVRLYGLLALARGALADTAADPAACRQARADLQRCVDYGLIDDPWADTNFSLRIDNHIWLARIGVTTRDFEALRQSRALLEAALHPIANPLGWLNRKGIRVNFLYHRLYFALLQGDEAALEALVPKTKLEIFRYQAHLLAIRADAAAALGSWRRNSDLLREAAALMARALEKRPSRERHLQRAGFLAAAAELDFAPDDLAEARRSFEAGKALGAAAPELRPVTSSLLRRQVEAQILVCQARLTENPETLLPAEALLRARLADLSADWTAYFQAEARHDLANCLILKAQWSGEAAPRTEAKELLQLAEDYFEEIGHAPLRALAIRLRGQAEN